MENADKVIEKMYGIARRLANVFYRKHSLTYLDCEDFIQEAMLGWLQGRPMLYAMIDAFRKAAPLARSQVGKMPLPRKIPLSYGGHVHDTHGDSDMFKAVLLSQLREVISEMDDITKDIMDRYFFQNGAETLEDIGKDHDVTGSAIWLKKRQAIKDLKEVYNDGSC